MAAALIPAELIPIARTDADWQMDIHFQDEDWSGDEVSVVWARQGLPAEAFELVVGSGVLTPTADLSVALRVPPETLADKAPGRWWVQIRRITAGFADDAAVFQLILQEGLSRLLPTPRPAPSLSGVGVEEAGVIVNRQGRVAVVRGGSASLRGVEDATAEALDARTLTLATEAAVAASEAARAAVEFARVAEEQSRADAEGGRVGAEDGRVAVEVARVVEEGIRDAAETARLAEEADRVAVEAARVGSEAARVVEEGARVDAEGLRVGAEQTRDVQEAARETQEDGRLAVEALRVTAEDGRATSEGQRNAAETIRGTNEDLRLDQETSRVTVEASRVVEEASRDAAEGGRVAVEALRVIEEADRVAVEASRVVSEDARELAETDRAGVEALRVTTEAARVVAEDGRDGAETIRADNETARLATEADRVTEEASRGLAEDGRVADEAGRDAAEVARLLAEDDRIALEGVRVLSEADRALAETGRATSESARALAEGGRVDEEILRVTAEDGRETAEEARVIADAGRQGQIDRLDRLVTVDARLYLAGDGGIEDVADIDAWIDAIETASAAGSRVQVTATGRFVLPFNPTWATEYPFRRCLFIHGAENVVFSMGGATWMYDSEDDVPAVTWWIENCKNVSGDLGRVVWKRPPFGQGVVASKTATTVDITLDAGFVPSFDNVQRVERYDRARNNLNDVLSKDFASGGDIAGWPVTYPSAGVMRINFAGDATALTYLGTMDVGDLYVATWRVYGGEGVIVRGCESDDLKAHVGLCGGMAFRSIDNTDSFSTVTAWAEGDNLIASTADGFHASSNRGSCGLEGEVWNAGDDPLNYSTSVYQYVATDDADTFRITTIFPNVLPRVGDSLALVPADGGAPSELGLIDALTLNVSDISLTMSEALPTFAAGDTIINRSATPDDVSVSLTGRDSRGRLLVSVPRIYGALTGQNLSGAVFVTYDPDAFGEASVLSDANLIVSARQCAIRQTQPAAINITAIKADGSPADAGTIQRMNLSLSVSETRNSAVRLAGVADANVSILADRACLDPDLVNYAWADKEFAQQNVTRISYLSLYYTGSVAAEFFTDNATDNRYGIQHNVRAPFGIISEDDGTFTIPSGPEQFTAPAIYIQPSLHATSERAAVRIADLLVMQDVTGGGTKDFSVFNLSSGRVLFTFSPDGSLLQLPWIRDTNPGPGFNAVWRDPAAGNVLKLEP